jgi:hypothetical protein
VYRISSQADIDKSERQLRASFARYTQRVNDMHSLDEFVNVDKAEVPGVVLIVVILKILECGVAKLK